MPTPDPQPSTSSTSSRQPSRPAPPDSLDAFIQSLPKTETHLHLEGALPYELLHQWDPARFPARPAFLSPAHRFPDFPSFDALLLGHAVPWFTSAQRYHDAARAVFARHLSQNVRYVEISFHLPIIGFIHTPGREILSAIRSAVPAGLEVRIFAGMLRDSYDGPLRSVIDDLENWDGLAGVDLHGNEAAPTQAWTAPVWQRLRAAGKITKSHAGEFDGPDRVREAIEQLGVTRIQHGVRAIEDPAVVALAAERGVTFDTCPISNVKLGVAPSLATHPLARLLRAGVRCTLSTDDPLLFGNTLNGEYAALATEAGFTRATLAQLACNGWDVADIPHATRTAMQSAIATLASA
ncbi:adenosine deaminase family protein [Geminisphaera colitermitum]|uniref:adenosine deaminase family protein n=1 Tax=Geminisphaera colitermitum TaxID=1148786 RepID=UPI0009DDDECB|nr:adenosine deaminase family protein [Geminisphaera colitermitum]